MAAWSLDNLAPIDKKLNIVKGSLFLGMRWKYSMEYKLPETALATMTKHLYQGTPLHDETWRHVRAFMKRFHGRTLSEDEYHATMNWFRPSAAR